MSEASGASRTGSAARRTAGARKPLGELRKTSGGEVIGSRIGVVDTDARDKTRKVVIDYKAPHPKYGKFVSRRTVLQVHDELNESHKGDVVEVAPCRPISKTKQWRLVRIVEQRSAAGA